MYILQLICCFNRFHMYITYRMDQISRFNLWVFRLRHFGRQEVTWSNWVTKGLRLIAFCSFIFASCLPHMCFGKCVFFSTWKNICQKEELCNTSVGCSWLLCKVCNPEKWCLLVKGSCASSLPAQLFSRCLSEQRTRTRDLQDLCAEATLPLCFWSSRAVSQRSFCWCSKRSHIVQFQLHRSRDTLVLCGMHRETLCLFEFLCDNFTVHSFQ